MFKQLLAFLFLLQIGHAQSATVFEAKINKGDKIGSQWKLHAAKDCKPVISESPKGNRAFIAKIPVGKQALAIPQLPDHTHIRIQFDLIIKGTWDGNHPQWGPDSWKFDIDGREPLVNGTFCNHAGNKLQSFPDFLGDSYKANTQFTNALESSTLGYMGMDRDRNVSSDSIYRFDFTIPHTKSSIMLNFESKFTDVGEEPNSEQWYGLDNVKVMTVGKPKQQTIKSILTHIDTLATNNGVIRHKARLSLLGNDELFVEVLEKHLKKLKNADISKIIPLLNDESYKVRVETTNKLLSLSKENIQLIEQALHNATQPEIIARLRHIVEEGRKDSKTDQQTEIGRLLRMIDTPGARKLLRTKSLKIK